MRLSSGKPDRAHLHQLIASAVVYPRLPLLQPTQRNSISGILASLMSVPALAAALSLYDNPWACIAAFLFFGLFYHLIYQALAKKMQAIQLSLREQNLHEKKWGRGKSIA
jgi:hypothetical protein